MKLLEARATTRRGKKKSAWRLPSLAALLLLAILTSPGQAQDAATAQEASPAIPSGQTNPRAAMEKFITAVNAENKQAAVEVLDLRQVPGGLFADAAWEQAVQLKDVIDRTRYVDYLEIPDSSSGPAYRFLVREAGTIELARASDGAWRFTPETVAEIPSLWRATRDQKVAEGARQVQLTPGLWLRSKMPPFLTGSGFLLELWQWLGLVILFGLGLLVSRLVAKILENLVGSRLSRKLVQLDRDMLRQSLRPWALLAASLVWAAGLLWLNLPSKTMAILGVAVKLFSVASLIWGLYRAVDILSAVLEDRAAKTDTRADDLLAPLIRKTLKIVTATFGVVFLVDNLGIEVSSLLTGVGLGGLAFALAAQDLLKNFFGSLMVVLDRPFQVGDWIQVGDVEGTVEEVGFRSTRVRTPYNSLVTLPNAKLIDTAVDNYGAREYRRWKTNLSLAYDTPVHRIEALTEGIRELIRNHPHTRKDAFEVSFNSFAAASIDLMVYVFWKVPGWSDELEQRQRLAFDILRLARNLGVELAFPTQTVYLRKENWEMAAGGSDSEPHNQRSQEAEEEGRKQAQAILQGSTNDSP